MSFISLSPLSPLHPGIGGGWQTPFHCRYRYLAFILLLSLLLVSCSLPSNQDPHTIRFVWFGSEDEEKALRACLTDFEQEYPPYKVQLIPLEWAKYNEKVMTMLIGHRPPNLARMSMQWCSRYRELGAFRDIRDWLAEDETGDFLLSRLESCKGEGELHGLPHTSVGLMAFYNRDLFEKAEIEVPSSPETTWNWDEFSKAARTVQEKTGVRYGWGAFRGWFPFLIFIYANDGYLLENGQPAFANPRNLEALEWFVEQYAEGVASRSSWSRGGDAAETIFLRGDCAMVITGNWRLATFSRQIANFDWDVTYLPRQKRRATNLGGENLMVFNTPGAEAATRLARFLTRPDQMERFCTQTMFLPTRRSLLNRKIAFQLREEAMQKFARQALDFEQSWAAEQCTPEFAAIEDIFLKQIELAVLELQTPRESLETLNREYRSAMEE